MLIRSPAFTAFTSFKESLASLLSASDYVKGVLVLHRRYLKFREAQSQPSLSPDPVAQFLVGLAARAPSSILQCFLAAIIDVLQLATKSVIATFLAVTL